VFYVPVWLELDMVTHFTACAEAKGVETDELLNDILRRQMEPAPAAER
jgi:hypothetical protein